MAEQAGPCPQAWGPSTQQLIKSSAQYPPPALDFGLRSIWLFLVGQFCLLSGSSEEVKVFYQWVIIEFLIPCLSSCILSTPYVPDTLINWSNKYLSVYFVARSGRSCSLQAWKGKGRSYHWSLGEWQDGEGCLEGSMQPTHETQKGVSR